MTSAQDVVTDSSTGDVLVAEALVRRFGDLTAVDGVSFRIGRGETYGLLGPNGAGKTTTINMIAGLIAADEGTVSIAGDRMDPATVAPKRHIGLVPQDLAIYPELTARENLAFCRDLFGNPALEPEEALERVGLAHAVDLPVAYLSAGQRRRVALARLLVAHRPLWLLDEPTAALDARSQATLLTLMQEHIADGGLIIAATHAPLGLAAQEIRIGSDGAGKRAAS